MSKYQFDSEAFIKEMEELNKGVEETPLDYEEFEEMAELLYFREEIFKLNRFKEEASRNISSIVTELKIEEGYEEEANAY